LCVIKNVSTQNYYFMKPLFTDPKEQDLIQKVGLVFIEKGMKAMTMDDIASELHVSKKTLYKYVKNRSELVTKCVKLRVHKEMENRTMLAAAGLNAIEENLKIMEFTSQIVAKTTEKVHDDLEKHFPEAFAVIQDYTNNFLLKAVLKNMEKGVKEGLYCAQINPKILAKMYISKIDLVFDGMTFPPNEFNLADVLSSVVIHNMRGMATSTGIKLIEEHTNQKYK
jgi:AcrR family transcriptional regulator